MGTELKIEMSPNLCIQKDPADAGNCECSIGDLRTGDSADAANDEGKSL